MKKDGERSGAGKGRSRWRSLHILVPLLHATHRGSRRRRKRRWEPLKETELKQCRKSRILLTAGMLDSPTSTQRSNSIDLLFLQQHRSPTGAVHFHSTTPTPQKKSIYPFDPVQQSLKTLEFKAKNKLEMIFTSVHPSCQERRGTG